MSQHYLAMIWMEWASCLVIRVQIQVGSNMDLLLAIPIRNFPVVVVVFVATVRCQMDLDLRRPVTLTMTDLTVVDCQQNQRH